MLRRCVIVVSFVLLMMVDGVTSVGVISGMLRGRGAGVGLGGKSGLV